MVCLVMTGLVVPVPFGYRATGVCMSELSVLVSWIPDDAVCYRQHKEWMAILAVLHQPPPLANLKIGGRPEAG